MTQYTVGVETARFKHTISRDDRYITGGTTSIKRVGGIAPPPTGPLPISF